MLSWPRSKTGPCGRAGDVASVGTVAETQHGLVLSISFSVSVGGWVDGWVVGWLVGWLAGWLASWLVGSVRQGERRIKSADHQRDCAGK